MGNIYSEMFRRKEEPTLLGEIFVSNADEKVFYNRWWTCMKNGFIRKVQKKFQEKVRMDTSMYFEGPIVSPDPWDRPEERCWTSESTLNEVHVKWSDPGTGKLRILI